MSDLPIRQIPGDYGLHFSGPSEIASNIITAKERLNSSRPECTSMNPRFSVATCRRARLWPEILASSAFLTLSASRPFSTTRKSRRETCSTALSCPPPRSPAAYRACAYLDPSEPNHAVLKGYFLSFLAGKHNIFIPLFRQTISGLLSGLEDEVSSKGSSNFNDLSDPASFEFVFRLLCDKSPSEANIGSKGPKMVDKWLFLQLAPLMTLGLKFVPKFLEDLLIHTFPLPFLLVKSDYNKLYEAFYKSAGPLLDEAERIGLKRDEACHNLVFLAGFNAFGGMKRLPFSISLLCRRRGNAVWIPANRNQRSKVFANPDDFIADRFVGEGEKLIEYVYWSNGRETDGPTTENKQCPGKELVVLLCRLMLVEFFLNYDTFKVDTSKLVFGSAVVTFKSLTKATHTSSISATIQC
ncbi:UNVERIFIED_CONTAM: Allene oxide synthase 3 [Sesamum calycinum]|uniref:Allene oxide synthase 3 n=1 Tax=Sesamum calycinum TaxID=2727403 RepID=A0AAW2PKI3_9LAMI